MNEKLTLNPLCIVGGTGKHLMKVFQLLDFEEITVKNLPNCFIGFQ
jgi:hypothetical protein